MDFGLSTEQDILKRSAREFLAAECPFELAKAMATDPRGCPAELWQKIADLGWTALPFPEQYGGAGGSIATAWISTLASVSRRPATSTSAIAG